MENGSNSTARPAAAYMSGRGEDPASELRDPYPRSGVLRGGLRSTMAVVDRVGPDPDDGAGTVPRSGRRGHGFIRVGVDAVNVSDVLDSLNTFGARYLGRVFSQHEQESCRGAAPVRARGLAARFAAKEATIKVLRPHGQAVPWKTIEVQADPDGWCELALSGEAARLAQIAELEGFSVSLTHEGELAVAVVAAWGEKS